MWQALRGRVLGVGFRLLLVAWLACSVVIAVWVFRTTGLEADRKSGPALTVLIFAVPLFVVTAVDEFMLHRIKQGTPVPAARRGSWVYGDNRPVHMPDYWKVAPCLAAAAVAIAAALDSGLTVLERVGAVALGSIVVAGLLVQVGFAFRKSKSMVGFAGALLSWLGAGGVYVWVVYVVT